MTYLSICLPIHPTEVLSLNEDTCADLVNRFGRNVRQVLSLYVIQSSSVLEGAKKGGHIRWHILKTETEVSSNFRDGCLNTYYVSVTLDQSVLDVVPDILDDSELSKLGRALGDDFDDIRKLSGDQLICVLQWLQEAKMIESFWAQENKSNAEVNSLESFGNYNTDLSFCAPPAYIASSLLSSDHTLPNPENCYSHAVDEFISIWNQFIALPEDQSTSDSASPEYVATPTWAVTSPKSDAAYPTPSLSVASPHLTSSSGRIAQHRPISTPLSTDSPYTSLETTPMGPATPFGSDSISSSYPTPSSPYVKFPLAEESCILQGPGIPSQSRLRYLQLCRAGRNGTDFLQQIRIERILLAEDSLLAQDPSRLLQPLLECSEADTLPSLNVLGLPVEWRGEKGAVEYYKLLEAVKEKTLVLSRLAKRIAQILFYLNCTWLEKHGKLGGATVTTFILNACPEEPNTPQLMKSRRDNITGCHKRQGKQCWMLVACLGAGVLLHGADTIDTIINRNFRIPQLNVFITFVLRTRPGTVHLLRSLDTVVTAIMLGASTADLRGVIPGITNALVRQKELACASAADQEAWTQQITEEIWQAMDAESIAKQKIPDIIPDF